MRDAVRSKLRKQGHFNLRNSTSFLLTLPVALHAKFMRRGRPKLCIPGMDCILLTFHGSKLLTERLKTVMWKKGAICGDNNLGQGVYVKKEDVRTCQFLAPSTIPRRWKLLPSSVRRKTIYFGRRVSAAATGPKRICWGKFYVSNTGVCWYHFSSIRVN